MVTVFSEFKVGVTLNCPLKYRACDHDLAKALGLFGKFGTTGKVDGALALEGDFCCLS